VFLKALRGESFDRNSKLSNMTEEFRKRLVSNMGPACWNRYLMHCEKYMNAFTKEAEYREKNVILGVESYQVLRRENSAVRTCFGLFGHTLGLDLPDEVFNHPVFLGMHLDAVDMVCWSNDIYSYNMEQAMGHTTNNIMSVLMKEKNIDLQGASDLVGEHFQLLVNRFIDGKSRLPSWGAETDATVAKFIMAMESWVKGNLEWSFETIRYFGSQREQVKETLVVNLKPRQV